MQKFYSNKTTNIKIVDTMNEKDPSFLGIQTIFTNELKFVNKECYDSLPTFRILNSLHKHFQLPKDLKV